MKRRGFLGALSAGLGGVLVPRSIWASSLGTYRRTGLPPSGHFVERWSWAMGQPVHLQLFADSADQGYEAAARALGELRRVEQHLTLFDDASDLCELNHRAGGTGLRVGGDLTRVLTAALRLERLTAGAFNPAVEPLMRAWGFRTPRSSEPTTAELKSARQSVRAARILVQDDRISLPGSATRLDLGGIGVGYGLDRAMETLRDAGIHNAFIDVSGDCIARGAPPGSAGWLVEIAGPHPGDQPVGSIRLRDAALATSANTMSVVRYGRAIRGHVMNPETGWPADALTQVTVVAGTGIEADALSTAMLVSGRPWKGVMRFIVPCPSAPFSTSPPPVPAPGRGSAVCSASLPTAGLHRRE
jgi:thiamine biosynthesis lipoprotein